MARPEPDSSRRRPLTRAEQKGATRRRLMDATIDVVARDGYESATMAAIGGRAGYTSGALQAHFTTKASALAEALRYQLRAADPPMLLDPDPTDPIAGLLRGFRAWLAPEHAGTRAALAEAIARARREPRLAAVAEEILTQRTEVIRQSLELAVERGQLDAGMDVDSLTFLVGAVLPAFAASGFVDRPPPDLTALLDTLDGCLRHGPGDRRAIAGEPSVSAGSGPPDGVVRSTARQHQPTERTSVEP